MPGCYDPNLPTTPSVRKMPMIHTDVLLTNRVELEKTTFWLVGLVILMHVGALFYSSVSYLSL